jgi:putative nucleotidyltransferase with HDIG domain
MKASSGDRTPPARRAAAPAAPPSPESRRRLALRRVALHGSRLAALLATAVAIYFLFPAARVSETAGLERGMVAPADVIASFGFVVPKDEETLRRERAEAAGGVPAVFDYRPAAADSVVAGLGGFFAGVDSALARPGVNAREEARAVLARAGVPVTLGALDVLADPTRRDVLRISTERAVHRLLPRGVAASSPGRSGVSAVRVRGVAAGERLVPADSVYTADQLFREAASALPPGAGADAAELQRLLLVRYFHPTLVRNEAATAAARERAMAAVDTVRATVLPGEKIVGAREQVGEREEARLRAYHAGLEARHEGNRLHTWERAIGGILYNALLLSILGVLLRLSRPHLYRDGRSVAFLCLIIVAVAGVAAAIARTGFPPELIPVPFATMVVAVLWGGRLALAVGLVLALVIGGQTPYLGMTVPFEAALAGSAAAFGVRVAERRLQTWWVVGIVAAAYAAAAVAMGLLRAEEVSEIGWTALWGSANAIASTLLAVGVLPLAEWLARVTTNQTLMELADPKHPLLRRLAQEAPGTYAHTISVANLAEAVCAAIGANPLLARVGVYYHDIGKVVKPQYFIENQPKGRNPHDKLKPSMSAAIVRSHVAEGLKLAEEHRLPDAVKAFIAQHHGTQTISYFLEQARRADPGARINPAEFSYGGPRPRTRETAVAMLADSVESASRVLPDPTPERIRELVEKIVGGKIAQGQLDDSPLTLREIHLVKEHLAKGLNGMYHHRVDYPAPPEAPAAEGAEPPPAPATRAG